MSPALASPSSAPTAPLPSLIMAPTGETFHFQTSARGPTGRFSFRWHLAPGKVGPGAHRHIGENEHFHVVRGRLDIHMDGRVVHLGPGDEATVPAGTLHHFGHPGDEETVVDVTLDGPGMEDMLVPMAVALPDGKGLTPGAMGRLVVHVAQGIDRGASVPGSWLERTTMKVLATICGWFGARAFDAVGAWGR